MKKIMVWRDRQGGWNISRGTDPKAEPHLAEMPDDFSVKREDGSGGGWHLENDGVTFKLVDVSGSGIQHKPYLLSGQRCIPLDCTPLATARLDVCPAAEYAFRSLVRGAGEHDILTVYTWEDSIVATLMTPDGMKPTIRIGVPISPDSIYYDHVPQWVPSEPPRLV